MSSKSDKITAILKEFEEKTPGVEASTLVTSQGLPIASALPTDDVDFDMLIAAMTASIMSVGVRATDELERGELEQIIIQGDNGYTVMTFVSEDAILTVLTKKETNLGFLFFQSKIVAQKIISVL